MFWLTTVSATAASTKQAIKTILRKLNSSMQDDKHPKPLYVCLGVFGQIKLPLAGFEANRDNIAV